MWNTPIRVTFPAQAPSGIPVTNRFFMPSSSSFEYTYSASGNGSQMAISNSIGVHENFRSVPSTAILLREILQNVRDSMQCLCQSYQTTSGRNFEHLL
ncbi:hypothetical protein TNCV_2813611 [Trichonephila clavipes]|nr:hypothetical protein TNCV_2813611 [Trichonephila clavipes]